MRTKTTIKTSTRTAIKAASCSLVALALFVTSTSCLGQQHQQLEALQQQQPQPQPQHRISAFAARRAADDSRPFKRIAARQADRSHHHHQQESNRLAGPSAAASETQPSSIVMGKFKAPAPDRVQRARLASGAQFGAQTMSASYRVADAHSELPEKIVHGVLGASGSSSSANSRQQQQQPQSVQRTVGAKMQVSDEGLNYPPSKLSADIYGNVAEIVTAPPEAVEGDFLLPQSSRFGQFNGKRR